jgi:hypothetical protein
MPIVRTTLLAHQTPPAERHQCYYIVHSYTLASVNSLLFVHIACMHCAFFAMMCCKATVGSWWFYNLLLIIFDHTLSISVLPPVYRHVTGSV